RGEIGVRIIRGCRELKIERVGIYGKGDENRLDVSLGDEGIWIGEANGLESYLNIDGIICGGKVTE
ncbi:biotin carboxylase N-terminal domain-containing protein, partial [Staphylococcus epidermidis]|uniref:biotin carboxylase N-terminal domain-containing protein n=1 Tax=Staphylococcus epidermidis TaxID=1282 RepID=UPI0037DA3FF5